MLTKAVFISFRVDFESSAFDNKICFLLAAFICLDGYVQVVFLADLRQIGDSLTWRRKDVFLSLERKDGKVQRWSNGKTKWREKGREVKDGRNQGRTKGKRKERKKGSIPHEGKKAERKKGKKGGRKGTNNG